MLDWNSLQSVSRWHSVFEIAGIVALALLVTMEVGAYIFGHRKDHLSSAEAEGRLQAVKNAQSPRRLSEDETMKFASVLRGRPSVRVIIATPIGDGEAKQYAQDFGDAFARAGWQIDPTDFRMASYGPDDPIGLVLGFSSPDAKTDPSDSSKTLTPLPPAAALLGDALRAAGLDFEFRYTKDAPAGIVDFRVGHKKSQ